MVDALSARFNFRHFFEWFKAKEDEELRGQRHNSTAASRELQAVRTAIKSMIPVASQTRIEFGPLRFVVSVMGVRTRPENNAFVRRLDRYVSLIGDDAGESEEARKLRAELDAISPRDPALDGADVEIRRRTVLKRMDKQL